MKARILIVGAGFAGATYARELAERGYAVDVIDRRGHIGGNAYDATAASGVRVHLYGPHLFHTNNAQVANWLTRFGEFVSYEHRVVAALPDGRLVPAPINRTTINEVFGERLASEAEVRAFVARQAEPIADPRNAAEYLLSQIGRTLTDLFFRPYTRKMWALDLEDLDIAVVKRIPLRNDDEDRYFPRDRYQMLPRHGYAGLFEAILDHREIRVFLNQAFERTMLASYAHCFNSMAIDEYFDDAFGPLPYRSIRFHHRDVPLTYRKGGAATMNYTDDGRFTRETDWSRLPGHIVRESDRKTMTKEEPCDYRDNAFERFYPVKTSDGRFDEIYDRYKALAGEDKSVTFIGRCGTYQYLDMHQVINQSRMGAHAWMGSEVPVLKRSTLQAASARARVAVG
jgi:UDP-galactopyranose mutase